MMFIALRAPLRLNWSASLSAYLAIYSCTLRLFRSTSAHYPPINLISTYAHCSPCSAPVGHLIWFAFLRRQI